MPGQRVRKSLARTGKSGHATTKNASGLACWPSRDPIGEQGGVNSYGFSKNSPIIYWDKLGQIPMVLPAIPIIPIIGVIVIIIIVRPALPPPPPSIPWPAPPYPTIPSIPRPAPAYPPIDVPNNPSLPVSPLIPIVDVGSGDPPWADDYSQVDAGTECDGNGNERCRPCPSNSRIWRHTHINGTVNCHAIIYNQDRRCVCRPRRVHVNCDTGQVQEQPDIILPLQ